MTALWFIGRGLIDVDAFTASKYLDPINNIGTPEYRRNAILMSSYGINSDAYSEMLTSQCGVCAVCGRTPELNRKKLAIDHCHKTGEIRGLLCSSCNIGIGNLGDDLDGLMRAVAYLKKCGTGRFIPKRGAIDQRGPIFPVKAIPIGEVALFSWAEYQASEPNATHGAFVKAIRQACYRAKPMKFRTAVYDDYEPGAVAVERIL